MPRRHSSDPWLFALFFASGVAALIYQVAWQRILFSAFGVDLESITLVVSAFMAGLGLGALLGGWLADRWPQYTLALFAAAEAATGIYGLISHPLLHWAGAHLALLPLPGIAVVNFALVLLPTLAMGATLPMLIAYLARLWSHVGAATGQLYAVNTFGAALGSLVSGFVLFNSFTLKEVILMAAAINLGIAVVAMWRFRRPARLASQR